MRGGQAESKPQRLPGTLQSDPFSQLHPCPQGERLPRASVQGSLPSARTRCRPGLPAAIRFLRNNWKEPPSPLCQAPCWLLAPRASGLRPGSWWLRFTTSPSSGSAQHAGCWFAEPGCGRGQKVSPLLSGLWLGAAPQPPTWGFSRPPRRPPVPVPLGHLGGPRGAWLRQAPGDLGITHPGCLLTARLFLGSPVRSATFKSTSPTPCSAACTARSAPFPWRRGSTSHSPTSPRTARASPSACPGTELPGRVRSASWSRLIADPIPAAPLESAAGPLPPPGPSPEISSPPACGLAFLYPNRPQSRQQTKEPIAHPRAPGGLQPRHTSEAAQRCLQLVRVSLDRPGGVSTLTQDPLLGL